MHFLAIQLPTGDTINLPQAGVHEVSFLRHRGDDEIASAFRVLGMGRHAEAYINAARDYQAALSSLAAAEAVDPRDPVAAILEPGSDPTNVREAKLAVRAARAAKDSAYAPLQEVIAAAMAALEAAGFDGAPA